MTNHSEGLYLASVKLATKYTQLLKKKLHFHHNPANQDLNVYRQLVDDTYISGIYVWNVSVINIIRFVSLSGKKLSLVVFDCRLFNTEI